MRRTEHRAAHPRSAAHAHDTALFVALELSRSTWLIGSSTPGSDRISKHQVPAADTTALLALLKRLKARAERHMKSTNMLERLNQKIKRRTHVVWIFPNAESCLRLVRALAVEVHENWLEAIRYLNMEHLKEHKKQMLRQAACCLRSRSA